MHPPAGKQTRPDTRQTRAPARALHARKILNAQSPAPVRKSPVAVRQAEIATDAPALALRSAESAAGSLNLRQEKTLTVKEAAFLLRKSPDAIYLWLRTGRLRGWQPGGRCCSIMVLESSVEQALVCGLDGN